MVVRKVVEIDEDRCTGCGKCITACAEGALQIVEGKAKVVSDRFCDGLGACIGECPEGALRIVERDVEEFDEAAAKEHVGRRETRRSTTAVARGACPSAGVHIFKVASEPTEGNERESKLGQWPIKLMLVPENAPFLRGEELVVLADCAAVAYASLHEKFVAGKAIAIGCPKFADAREYTDKLSRIMRNGGIKGLTVVHMEVPCCFGLVRIVEEAVRASQKDIPVQEIVITRRGSVTGSA